MARITVEDCLKKEPNRFALVQLAAKRTKQILAGSPITIQGPIDNKHVVVSLREIEAGNVRFMTESEMVAAEEERKRKQAEQQSGALGHGPVMPLSPMGGGASSGSILDEANALFVDPPKVAANGGSAAPIKPGEDDDDDEE